MSNKISSELRNKLEEVNDHKFAGTIPVVVQTEVGTDSAILAATGMVIDTIVPSISMISGRATKGTIYALEALGEVKSIEYDGTVSAF